MQENQNLSHTINFPDPGEESPIEDLDDLQEADYDIQEDDFDQIPGIYLLRWDFRPCEQQLT